MAYRTETSAGLGDERAIVLSLRLRCSSLLLNVVLGPCNPLCRTSGLVLWWSCAVLFAWWSLVVGATFSLMLFVDWHWRTAVSHHQPLPAVDKSVALTFRY